MIPLRALFLLVPALLGAAPAFAQVNEQWVRTFETGAGGYNTIFAIGFDAQGNLVTTGSSGFQASGGPQDIVTLKYDPAGNLLWHRSFDGFGGYDEALALALVPSDSSIYCAGRSNYTGGSSARVLHYDASGNLIWTSALAGISGFVACALAPNGDLVAAGSSQVAGNEDFLVVRFAPDGSIAWNITIPFSAGLIDFVRALALDTDGNIYLTGAVNSTGPNQNVGLAKVSPQGVLLWQREFSGTAVGFNQGVALAIGPAGSVTVAGTTNGIGTGQDGVLLRYDALGNLLWVRQPATPGGPADYDSLDHVRIDSTGRVYCAGQYLQSGGWPNLEFASYDDAGNLLWQDFWDSPGSGYDGAMSLLIDPAGNSVLLDVPFFTSGGPHSAFTLRHDRDGHLRSVHSASVFGFCRAAALADEGNLAIGGRSESGGSNMLLILERPQARVLCVGDGLQAPCPCGNSSLLAQESGCLNSQGSAGHMIDQGAAHLAADTLQLATSGLLANGLCILAQGSVLHAPNPFGDGLFCLGGALKRMYVRNANAGALLLPGPADPSLSLRSAQLGDPLASGSVRGYQVYYRDPSTLFCTAATFNVSNALRVEWVQ
jgi:hypothetical protein